MWSWCRRDHKGRLAVRASRMCSRGQVRTERRREPDVCRHGVPPITTIRAHHPAPSLGSRPKEAEQNVNADPPTAPNDGRLAVLGKEFERLRRYREDRRSTSPTSDHKASRTAVGVPSAPLETVGNRDGCGLPMTAVVPLTTK
jgi:hypothetical protein